MTLFRQISLIILILFGIVFCGTLAISVNNTRLYLNDQLASHAQDTATSLGLSLSPHVEAGDKATMNSMIDAIFDRGYYRTIALHSVSGEKLIERSNDIRIEGIPPWFIRLIPLETPSGEALVMAGWNQAGSVKVTSHPGYAYAELWRTAVSTSQWLLGCLAAVLLLAAFLLGLLLRPLKAVERQAEAICDRQYPVQDTIPRTRELKQVVLAMNRMVNRVRQMFEEQSSISEGLRTQAYEDGLTGMGNRRYFNAQLHRILEERDDNGLCALLLVELDGFKDYNDRHGYESGDDLIRQVAGSIAEVTADLADAVAARLTGAVFAILACRTSPDDAAEIARRLCDALTRVHLAGFPVGANVGHVGVAMLPADSNGSEWLANADRALRTAKSDGPNAWHMRDQGIPEGYPKGARDWRAFLEHALAERRLKLHFQPVVTLGTASKLLHQEVLLRAYDESGLQMPAAAFLPMAERVGLGRELDRACLSLVLEHMRKQSTGTDTAYAVNLSPPSLADRAFVDWLVETLSPIPETAARIIFETSEYGAIANIDAVKSFLTRIGPMGAKFALEHFGRGFTSFAYLPSLRIDHLKIDGSYIRQIDTQPDNRFFVQAMAKTAHDLEIRVIAENVESPEELATLKALKVDGVRGYLIGHPSEVEITPASAG